MRAVVADDKRHASLSCNARNSICEHVIARVHGRVVHGSNKRQVDTWLCDYRVCDYHAYRRGVAR